MLETFSLLPITLVSAVVESATRSARTNPYSSLLLSVASFGLKGAFLVNLPVLTHTKLLKYLKTYFASHFPTLFNVELDPCIDLVRQTSACTLRFFDVLPNRPLGRLNSNNILMTLDFN